MREEVIHALSGYVSLYLMLIIKFGCVKVRYLQKGAARIGSRSRPR